MTKWPDVYEFGKPFGPVHDWFAWRPVRLYYGKWAWLKTVKRCRVSKFSTLAGPDRSWWTYSDEEVSQ